VDGIDQGNISWTRSIDPDQLPLKVCPCLDRLVNSPRLSHKVRIHGTDNDPSMFRLLLMKSNKVPAVEGQNRPAHGNRKFKHFRIGNRFARPSLFLDRHNIVPQRPQFMNNRNREVRIHSAECSNHRNRLALRAEGP